MKTKIANSITLPKIIALLALVGLIILGLSGVVLPVL